MNLRDTYNKIAQDWTRDHSKDDWWHTGTDKFLSLLQLGDSVLDVGCGGGHKTRYFVEKGFDTTAIDFSEEMIKIVREQIPNVIAEVRDITQPLNLNKTFQGVFAQAVLLHIPKAQVMGVLNNLVSVLEPGGYFYVAVKERVENQSEEEIIQENDYGYDYERFFSFYTLSEMQSYIKQLGLTEVFADVTPGGETNWVQIIAKK